MIIEYNNLDWLPHILLHIIMQYHISIILMAHWYKYSIKKENVKMIFKGIYVSGFSYRLSKRESSGVYGDSKFKIQDLRFKT